MEWSQLLLNSFRHWTGRELLERAGDPDYQAHALFQSPFVVVSHGMEEDPLLNYGNQIALELWEMTWEELTRTPSRLTVEPTNRAEREWMLEQARTRGYLDTYQGVRIAFNRTPLSRRERPHLECRGCRGTESRAGCHLFPMDLVDLTDLQTRNTVLAS